MRSICFLIIIVIFYSCSQQKDKQLTSKNTSDTLSKISIHQVGALSFRKSYAGAQFIEDEKERDRYEAQQDKSNPEMDGVSTDTTIEAAFKKEGFVKNNELLLSKFKYDTALDFKLANSRGEMLNGKFMRIYTDSISNYRIQLKKNGKTGYIILNDYIMELKYALLDIIPGGYKEIVVLNEYYIVLGYNFDFQVFEVKE